MTFLFVGRRCCCMYVRHRRWLDTDNHNVMSEFDFIQESTRCSKELADFFKKCLEALPITARSFEKDYHINGDNFERSYKETISAFKTWEDADHAEDVRASRRGMPK